MPVSYADAALDYCNKMMIAVDEKIRREGE